MTDDYYTTEEGLADLMGWMERPQKRDHADIQEMLQSQVDVSSELPTNVLRSEENKTGQHSLL